MNAQPPPLPVAGLSLPRSAELLARPAELLARLPEDGAAPEGEPPRSALAAGAGFAGWDAIGAALVGAGAGTDET
jgi:hypothetical protein